MIKFNDNESISLQCNSIKAVNSIGTAFMAETDNDVITKAYGDEHYSGSTGNYITNAGTAESPMINSNLEIDGALKLNSASDQTTSYSASSIDSSMGIVGGDFVISNNGKGNGTPTITLTGQGAIEATKNKAAFMATNPADIITKAYADANYSNGGGGGTSIELYKEYDINSEADLIAAVDELNTGNIIAATLWMNEEWNLTQDIELAPQVCQYIYMDGVFGMGQGGDNYEFSLNNANYLICMDIYNPIRVNSNAKSALFNTDYTSRYISTSNFHSEALYTIISNTDIDPTGNGEFSVSNGICIVTNGTTITSGAMMSFAHCIAYFDGGFATDYATEISIANCWHN